MSSRGGSIGVLTIIASNLLLNLTLLFLRNETNGAAQGTLVLACANILSAFMFIRKGAVLKQEVRRWPWILLWAASYCVNYSMFLMLPNYFSLAHLVIAQSVAPIAALLISGDWRKETHTLSSLIGALVSLLILGALVLEEIARLDSYGMFGLPFLISVGCFLFSQTAARVLAGTNSGQWVQPRLALTCGVGLLVVNCCVQGFVAPELKWRLMGSTVAIGLLIVTMQRLYLYGLRRSVPVLSALAICSNVPLSIWFEALAKNMTLSGFEIGLCIAYCSTIGLNQLVQRYFRLASNSKIQVELT